MSELILFTSDDGRTQLHLRVDGGTIWLTQAEIADLFQTTKQNVSLHAKNILDEGELRAEATVKESLTVQTEGNRNVKRAITFYNLDLILSIGYRVRSPRGTQFRQWATTHLREYLVKGFVMDDQRLKDPGGWDYFDELLARIREIRASEKRFYQKVRDLFSLSSDFTADESTTQTFFAEAQNKLHFAATGKTAAEIVVSRARTGEHVPDELERLACSQTRRTRREELLDRRRDRHFEPLGSHLSRAGRTSSQAAQGSDARLLAQERRRSTSIQ